MIKLENIQRLKSNENKRLTSVNLSMADSDYIKNHNIILSKLISETIKELKNRGNENDQTLGN